MSNVNITINGKKLSVPAGSTILEAGDVLTYQCDVPHKIENAADGASQLYMTVKFA